MLASSASRGVVRVMARRVPQQQQQRRGFIDYLTKYPDTIMEKKKLQMAGGVKQGEANPTWLKQPGDAAVAWFGFAVTTFGMIQWGMGFYNLAYNKNKMD